MSTWVAIALAVAGSTSINVGKVLQKKGADQLPRIELKPQILWQYIRCITWIVGLVCDISGGLILVVSFAFAPVSIVQPVTSVGLAALALFQYFYLKTPLTPLEWLAVVLAIIGTVGLGVTESSREQEDDTVDEVDKGVLIRLASSLVVFCIIVAMRRIKRRSEKRLVALPSNVDAVVAGLEAGVAFAFSSVIIRTGWQHSSLTKFAPVLGLGVGILTSASGFYVQNSAFKDGSAVLVCTAATVSSMAGGVLMGVLILGERLPSGQVYVAVRFLSWAILFIGITILAMVKTPTDLAPTPPEPLPSAPSDDPPTDEPIEEATSPLLHKDGAEFGAGRQKHLAAFGSFDSELGLLDSEGQLDSNDRVGSLGIGSKNRPALQVASMQQADDKMQSSWLSMRSLPIV